MTHKDSEVSKQTDVRIGRINDLTASTSHLIAPHGGELVQLQVPADYAAELKSHSKDWPSWDLTARQLCDLELLMNGGFSPLRGFMNRKDYEGVCEKMRLADGTLWPMPITLDVTEEFAKKLTPGSSKIALRDPEGVMLAVINVGDVWQPDRTAEAKAVFNSTSSAHPGSDYAMNKSNPWYVGGSVQGMQAPSHYDFRSLRLTPAALRASFGRLGWTKIVAFQTRNPMHRAHVELTMRAAKQVEANLLIHPSVGMTKPGDVDYFVRTRCYQLLLSKYPHGTVELAMLPLAMRMGGPREALWHGLIRKNYGCTHFIVGRDRAGPGKDTDGKNFYGPYDAQELFKQHTAEMGVTIFFTGLSGSGKSTIANALITKFLEMGGRPVTLLDGDLVRKHLSSELGFSKEHRDINIRRIGYVASEITKNGGIAVCAPIAPYEATRKAVRQMIEPFGGFILVHAATSIDVCEQRDRKGLYAKARAGIVKEFTGISDPYEAPTDAEVVIDTAKLSPEEAAQTIILHLEREGFVGANGN